ncbi:MAG: helix-turn-helix domain-containing protein [Clostridiales bacterium]|nr:helix-turn-helix domain-containing protein [Clostridiales bacterium]
MNQKLFGMTVTRLRKRAGMTQAELAKSLNVSDKAVSKWETGLGYPEITLLPRIAAVFGVTVDYLLTGERKGIAIAGNIITDLVKTIHSYPTPGMLVNIHSVSRAVGGCAANTAIDLARIDASVPISVLGCVGDDEYGRHVISQLQRSNIDTSGVKITDAAPTSFTDVMSLPGGERTFFHARGANALFAPSDVDIAALPCSMLHIGYILLLDQFDQKDDEYGTVMARFLRDVQEAGIKTSIDVVSENRPDYPELIKPALQYCDYVIINEIECCAIWGLDPRKKDGTLNLDALKDAMERTIQCGVKEKVIVHCKEAGCCLDASGAWTVVPSLQIPAEEIKGSVGAGDAFCAGCLYALYHHYTDSEMLEFASAAAACNLFAENAVDGLRSRQEILQVMQHYPRRDFE